MPIDFQTFIFYAAISLVSVLGSFLIRSVLSKIDSLEARMNDTTSEIKVRQLIKDRYDPLAQDIRDIKEKLDKLFDIQLDNIKQTTRDKKDD